MKESLLLIVLIFFASCSVVTKNNKYVKNFKEEFKLQAYCSCVLEGYENKSITSKMVEIDKSFYNPVIYSFFSKDIIQITLNESKIMKLDSLNSIKKVAEGKAGKNILSHCLKFYSSKKLDSITNIKFKEWKNIKNLDSILSKSTSGY